MWDPELISDPEQRKQAELERAAQEAQREVLLAKVQEGEDIDKDLRVNYWNSPDEWNRAW